MKALSLKLVKGEIDQVEQKVQFTWVQPRVLDIQQVSGLRDRLATWATTVNQTLILLEGETPELFV
jgi:26S proteasome regulatory subunit N9